MVPHLVRIGLGCYDIFYKHLLLHFWFFLCQSCHPSSCGNNMTPPLCWGRGFWLTNDSLGIFGHSFLSMKKEKKATNKIFRKLLITRRGTRHVFCSSSILDQNKTLLHKRDLCLYVCVCVCACVCVWVFVCVYICMCVYHSYIIYII